MNPALQVTLHEPPLAVPVQRLDGQPFELAGAEGRVSPLHAAGVHAPLIADHAM